VTYLGDDDGLLPNALAVANKIVSETGCKAISSKWHHYTWPNFDGVMRPNWLTVKTGQDYEVRNAKAALKAVLKGQQTYLELPAIYIGGFAEYETLNGLRNDSGRFFCSRAPDVYAAVALASTLNEYVYIKQPISICGASAHSIGASQFGFSTNSSAIAAYNSEGNIPFHPALGNGNVKSTQLLVYEAYLQSSHLHKGLAAATIAEQLALSIAHSNDPAGGVEDYCRNLAEAHKLDFCSIKRSARIISARHGVRTIVEKLRSPFSSFGVDGGPLGIMDICDAAIASECLHFQSTSNSKWKIRKLAGRVF
jgi:hypothetical protein